MDTETDYANLEAEGRVDLSGIASENSSFDKLVFGCLADNMRLPFADNVFEAYISNLSLMIVQHRERMIQEAFRVLKPGSRACFTTWGKEENCSVWHIFRQAFYNLDREPPVNDFDRYFALSSNIDELRQLFVDVGFQADEVRIWHQPCNWLFENGEDYWNGMCLRIAEEDRDEAIKTEMCRLFEESKSGMLVFEKCFILALKPSE